jgi:gentisate 1,2-dioxygenase
MEAVQKTPEREAFYRKIDGENLSALWNVLGDLVTPEPRSACRPHLWKFDSIRDYMTEAGKLITAKEAERRVLVLENPGLRGQSKVTTSLFAGVQMVVPGDVAPAHRHSQSALRFVLEGKGAHTTVDGERTAMEPGDFVITPSMTWHDHSNETSEPMFWLDGLDIPMVQFFDASFAEGSNEDQQKISKPAGDSFARYGHNLLPVDEKRKSKTSPIFNYPYNYTREALELAKTRDEWDACHGLKLKFSNPETGDFAMPTIGTFIQLLPKGFKTARYRATDATVFAAIEGKGRTRIGDQIFEWGRATCSWCRAGTGSRTRPTPTRCCSLLRPPGAAEARFVPRRSRQRVRLTLAPRHCERSEAIHRAASGGMDCFVASPCALLAQA